MPETAVAEPIVSPVEAPVAAEPSGSFDPAQLDALLEQMGGAIPTDEAAEVAPAAPVTEPVAPAKPAVEPAKGDEPPVKLAKPATKTPVVNDPLSPPPSVLGEPLTEPAVDEIEKEFGTIPEKPARGFKDKVEEANWTSIRQSHEKLKTELRDMRATAQKAPEPDAAAQAQIAELTERVGALNSIVERKAIEEHPWVVKNFDEPRKAAIGAAEKALKLSDVEPAQLAKVLALDGKERVAALDALYESIDSSSTRERLTNAINQIEMIDEKKAEFMADRKVQGERMTQAEQAEHYRKLAEEEKGIESAIESTVDFLANKAGFEFLKKATEAGSEKWNERVTRDLDLIRDLALKNKNPQRFITAIALGVQAPHYRAAWQNERKGRLAAEQKVAEYEGALPGKSSSGKPDVAVVTGDADLDAAGVTPDDDLPTMSRKLGALYASR